MASSKRSYLQLTAQQVKEKWGKGYYSPAGYLWHLIQALRKEGWWYRIESVERFCKDWEMHKRAFYRAKSALIAQGALEESLKGVIEIRIPSLQPVTNLSNSATNLSNSATNLSDPMTNLSTSATNLSDPMTNSSKLATNSSKQNPEVLSQKERQRSSRSIQSFTDPSQNSSQSSSQIATPIPSTDPLSVCKREPVPASQMETKHPGRTPPHLKRDTQRYEQQFQLLPPWLTGQRWSEIHPDFAAYLRTYLPGHIPYFENKNLDMPAIKSWAMKARSSEDRFEAVQIAWEAFQEQHQTAKPALEDVSVLAQADIQRDLADWKRKRQQQGGAA